MIELLGLLPKKQDPNSSAVNIIIEEEYTDKQTNTHIYNTK